MTDILGKLLCGMLTPQPLCRRCDMPAFVVFNDELLCAGHAAAVGKLSELASGLASSGDEVTGSGLPSFPRAEPVTDPSCGGVEGHAQLSEEAPRRGVAEKRSPDKRQCSAQARPAGIKPGPQDFSKNLTASRNRALNSIEPNGVQVSCDG